ncbi:MAG: IclR family transcriptional regulator [Leucobacter sp.]|nr:IclR family transcriptional regulator [Leucobacter sp.]
MDGALRIPGTQVVGRVAGVLRVLSAAMPAGASTTDLARASQITRPTAHRLLSALAEEGFVDREPHSGRWLLGPELYLMGTVAAERYDVTEIARAHVTALASATGESAFFSVRRGSETVCLERQDGNFPIRSFVLHEGKRFPLGVASAGLAILSFLPTVTVDSYLNDVALAETYGEEHSPAALRHRIAETRRTGYAVNPGLIVPGSWGIGAAVFTRSGQPAWALTLTGIESRFSPERIPELGRLLLEHAHQLTEQLARR